MGLLHIGYWGRLENKRIPPIDRMYQSRNLVCLRTLGRSIVLQLPHAVESQAPFDWGIGGVLHVHPHCRGERRRGPDFHRDR